MRLNETETELEKFVEKNKAAILPTDEQIEAFVRMMINDHSWYKRFSGEAFFIIYIAVDGAGRVSKDHQKLYGDLRYNYGSSLLSRWCGYEVFPPEITRLAVRVDCYSYHQEIPRLIQAAKDVRKLTKIVREYLEKNNG